MRDIWIFYSRCTITFIFTQLLVAASCCHLLHYVNKVHIVLKIKDNLKSYPQYVHKNQGKQVENNFKYWFPNSLENSKVLFQNINRIRKFMIRSEERRSWFKILVLEKSKPPPAQTEPQNEQILRRGLWTKCGQFWFVAPRVFLHFCSYSIWSEVN